MVCMSYTRTRETCDVGIIGRSQVMQRVQERLERLARSDVTTLVCGETGTGKEIIAQALHRLSARSSGPWVCVNCAGIPDGLVESELFGHVKGAFTGAVQDRLGRFEQAYGGTLFLDEIGDISPAVQVRLLRAVETSASSGWGAIGLVKSMFASSPRPINHSMKRCARADFASISTIASISPRSSCLPCEAAGKTSRCSFSISSSKAIGGFPIPSQALKRMRWSGLSATLGPETCASCATPSSARASTRKASTSI